MLIEPTLDQNDRKDFNKMKLEWFESFEPDVHGKHS